MAGAACTARAGRMTMRILVVDDDALMRETLRDILEDAGFQIMTAGRVSEALEVLGAQAFDLMLVDLNLPDGAGTALALEARQKRANLRVILMTGEADLPKEQTNSVDAYLVKPVEPPVLLTLLNKALAR